MRITKNREILEKKCEGIYYTEGIIIANKLRNVVIFGKHNSCIGLAHNQIGGNKNVFIAKAYINEFTVMMTFIIKDSFIERDNSCFWTFEHLNKIGMVIT